MEPKALFFVLLAGIGLATGTLTGLTGASGMSVLISALLLVGLEIRDVIGLTFVVTLANAITSIGPYWKNGHLDARTALLVSAPAIVAVVLGHQFSNTVKSNTLTSIMILCLFFVGIKFVAFPHEKEDEQTNPMRPHAAPLVLMGCVAGFIMGIMGGGGAVFIGAVLILLLKFPTKSAIGTSVLIMGVAAIPGVVSHYFSGTIQFSYAALILATSIPAALGASLFANRIAPQLVKRILGLYLIVISCVLLIRLYLY